MVQTKVTILNNIRTILFGKCDMKIDKLPLMYRRAIQFIRKHRDVGVIGMQNANEI